YFATADARSTWTETIDPHFQNFSRAPCHLVMTRGRGIGGVVATRRVRFPESSDADCLEAQLTPRDAFAIAVRSLVEELYAMHLLTAVHAGVTAPVSRHPLSKNSLSLRPDATNFDAVFMVEGVHRPSLEVAMSLIKASLNKQH